MKFQVLISTMFEKNHSILERMHIDSDCVIVNQTDCESFEVFKYNNHSVVWINSLDRGLSKSRNLALRYCDADIVLLADNDEIFVNDYEDFIIQEFEKNRRADLLCFNIKSIDNVRKRYINKKKKRLNFWNIFRYGSARIAFKRKFIVDNNIRFNNNFGAGTNNGGGEDSLFLNDFLRHKGNCFSSCLNIAEIDDRCSTWFKGYNDDYFINLGKFNYVIKKRLYYFMNFIVLLKRKNIISNKGFIKCLRLMNKGSKIAKELSL